MAADLQALRDEVKQMKEGLDKQAKQVGGCGVRQPQRQRPVHKGPALRLQPGSFATGAASSWRTRVDADVPRDPGPFHAPLGLSPPRAQQPAPLPARAPQSQRRQASYMKLLASHNRLIAKCDKAGVKFHKEGAKGKKERRDGAAAAAAGGVGAAVAALLAAPPAAEPFDFDVEDIDDGL